MYKNKDKNMAYISIIAIVAIVGMFIMFFSTATTKVSTTEQEDLTGFYFRKDLCSGFLPSNDSGVLDEVKRFVSKDLEIKLLKETPEHLTLSIKDREYMVTAHIGELYADEISINFYPSLFK